MTPDEWQTLERRILASWPQQPLDHAGRGVYREALEDLTADQATAAVASLVRDGEDALPPPGRLRRRAEEMPRMAPPPDPSTLRAEQATDVFSGLMSGKGMSDAARAALDDRNTGSYAVASLVLGLLGIFVVPLICSLIAMVLGGIVVSETGRDPSKPGRNMGLAGLILGVVGTLMWVALIILVVVFAANLDWVVSLG